jgi:hypothetical protein
MPIDGERRTGVPDLRAAAIARQPAHTVSMVRVGLEGAAGTGGKLSGCMGGLRSLEKRLGQ